MFDLIDLTEELKEKAQQDANERERREKQANEEAMKRGRKLMSGSYGMKKEKGSEFTQQTLFRPKSLLCKKPAEIFTASTQGSSTGSQMFDSIFSLRPTK